MTTQSADEQTMVGYLLGELPEEEQVRVEQRFFTDDDYFDQLLAVEDELVYDCAQGRLPPREQEHFAARYLASRDGKRRVETARSVVQALSRDRLADAATRGEERSPGTTVRLKPDATTVRLKPDATTVRLKPDATTVRLKPDTTTYDGRAWLAWAAAAVLAAGLAWSSVQTMRLRQNLVDARAQLDRQSASDRASLEEARATLERERAARTELEQRAASAAPPGAASRTPIVLSLSLTPGLVRSGSDAPRRLVITPGIDQVQLHLDLPAAAAHQIYRAVIRTAERTEVASQGGLQPRQGSSARVVTVAVASNALEPADYELVLQGVTPGNAPEDVAEYYFTIARK